MRSIIAVAALATVAMAQSSSETSVSPVSVVRSATGFLSLECTQLTLALHSQTLLLST